MNFVWLDINASWSHSSLALPALHANLSGSTASKCNMKVVRGTVKSPISQIIGQLELLEPHYIFATGWLFNIDYLLAVLGRVSSLCSPKGIFLGGPEFLGDNTNFLKNNSFITAVFKGEGEEIFEPFISSLLNSDEKWREIPGFEFIDMEGMHRSLPVSTKEFISLAPPTCSPLFSWDKSFVQLETSRGCFNSCRFCVSGIDRSPVTDIPVEELGERLKLIVSKGIRQVRVLDRTFNANPLRAISLLQLFSEFAGQLNFHLEVHPALLHISSGNDSSPVAKLRQMLESLPAGLLHLEAGIQTLQQDVLDNCGRKGSCANSLEGLKFLVGCTNFEVHADLIAGLPGYTFNSLVDDTFSLMAVSPAEIQLESLKLLPGTHFRNMSELYGIKYSPFPPYEVLSTPSISYNDLSRSMVLSRILDYWYNDKKWRKPFGKIFSANRELLLVLIDELSEGEFISQTMGFEAKGLLLYSFCKRHCPSNCAEISLQWAHNGLSMKKEPAEMFVKWNYGDTAVSNPIFVEGNPRYRYFYLHVGNCRHWFAYNKEIERVAPCNSCTEEL